MNNTRTKRNLTIAAVLIAATLVVGTFATTLVTQSAFASNNNSGNTVTAQINTQDGTQSGFDNNQSQEAQNVICTHPDDNASCVQERAVSAAAQAPIKLTCEQCFTKLLTTEQIQRFISNLDDFPHTLDTICSFDFNEFTLRTVLGESGVTSRTVQDELIACLLQAGITIIPSKA